MNKFPEQLHLKVQLDDSISLDKFINCDSTKDFLNIFSNKVLTMIKTNKKGWEDLVPTYVDNIIKENKLFGYNQKKKL